MAEYKLTLNAPPQELEGGTPIAPGEVVELTPEESKMPQNLTLIDGGFLLPLKQVIKKGGGK